MSSDAGARSSKGDVTTQLLLHELLTRRAAAIIGAVVMLSGIGFLAVITAAVTAALIDSSRRRSVESEQDLAQRLEDLTEQLARIESSLAGEARHGAS